MAPRRLCRGCWQAIQHKRFLRPSSLGPYELPWLAALSIAARDPWPEADAWLAVWLAAATRWCSATPMARS